MKDGRPFTDRPASPPEGIRRRVRPVTAAAGRGLVPGALLALALLVGTPASGTGQEAAMAGRALPAGALPGETMPEGCEAPEHRQFDFWIGEWEVTNPDGEVVGHNTIRRVSGGCGLLESWEGAQGGTGHSLNMYEPSKGGWTQTWVGVGVILHLAGGLEDGAMVMSSRRTGPRGEVMDRITWTPMEDGTVVQRWDMSTDGGETWQTAFEGTYTKTGGAGDGGGPGEGEGRD